MRDGKNAIPPAKWYAFLAHLAELKSPNAVARIEGMPSGNAFRRKMRADPVFAARVDALWIRLKTTDAVWETFLDHLRHLSIPATCALPGMPDRRTFDRKRRSDPAFDARVTAIITDLDLRQLHRARFQASHWVELAGHLSTMSLREACELPGMPSYTYAFLRMRSDPVFAARVVEARGRQTRALSRYNQALEPDAAADIWERFLRDLATTPLHELCSQAGMPRVPTVCNKRLRDPAFNERFEAVLAAKGPKRGTITPERWAAFIAGLASCSSIRGICREPGMPCAVTVRHRCRSDPEFRALVAEVLRRRTKARIAGAVTARRRRPARVKPASAPVQTFARQLSRNAIYRAVSAVVPASLPPITRDDIVCEMVLAVLEGQLAMNELKARAKDFVREHWRMFGTLRDLSLDALMFDDGGATLGDRVSGHGADYW